MGNKRPLLTEAAKSLLFIAGFAVIFCLIYDEMKGRYILSASEGLKRANVEIDEVEVVSLGSSHAANNVRPQWFETSMVSFASPGQDLFETAYKAEAARRMFQQLNTVLISVSFFSFHYDNGQYDGAAPRFGRRVDMYAKYDGGAPYLDDFAYYLKGQLANMMTRDHLEWYFITRMGFDALIPKERFHQRKPEGKAWDYEFKGNENTISHPLYVNLDEHLTLVGYEIKHPRLFSCNKGVITWYWYCRKRIPRNLEIRTFLFDDNRKTHRILEAAPFASAYPLENWRPGRLIKYRQHILVPQQWTSMRMGVALNVMDSGDGTEGASIDTDIDWPLFTIEFPVRHLEPAPAEMPALAELYRHSCVRAQSQSRLIDAVLKVRPTVVEDSYEVLRETVSTLQAAGIRPILYTAPFYRAYNARFRKRCQDTMYKQLSRLIKETNVEYYDFSQDERFVDKASLFRNTDHLNDVGKHIFSTILNDIVIGKGSSG